MIDLTVNGRAQRLDVEVATLSNRGEIWQTGAQALDVQAGQLINEGIGQVDHRFLDVGPGQCHHLLAGGHVHGGNAAIAR